MEHAWLLGSAGLLIGTLGTMLGIGGGFILVPLLAYLYPDWPPERLTSISLAVIFLNSLSGSLAHARKRRIHFRSGSLFLLTAIPGAIVGAHITTKISRATFDPVFGIFLLLVSGFLFFKPTPKPSPTPEQKHPVAYSLTAGLAISVLVGLVSTILGIGGGIIHVPAMVHLLRFPVHVATATSQMILAGMSLVATGVHLWQGDLKESYAIVLLLAPSVIIGAQLGARLSQRVTGVWIIRILAILLVGLGLRLLLNK